MGIGKKTDSRVPLLAAMVCIMFVADTGAEQVMLTGEDLSAWRGSTGQWQIVGDVFMNPANEKTLSVKSGTGVVVNGPKGRTSHLLSKAEFGDIKAHIEFMVPGSRGQPPSRSNASIGAISSRSVVSLRTCLYDAERSWF